MEIVAPTLNANGVSPFHNRDVREWSRIDNLTGALERARLETDHWSASTNNSAHKYNKVVDSRARSDADGAVQQHARRQLEVYQSSVPGERLQVIKTHTVSSSRWSSKSTVLGENKDIAKHFEDLDLSLNSLDLSSQKSKATVGRSIGKRPPSRPRIRDELQSSISAYNNSPLRNAHTTTNLHRVARLCHQVHDNAAKNTFGAYTIKPSIRERQNGGGEAVRNETSKPTLSRTRSSSSEEINLLTPCDNKSNKSIEDLEDLEQLQSWRRASKVRRSLQFPKQTRPTTLVKPLDLPKNTGSVRRIREDLETGRRLNTALRGNNVDLEALDQILQSLSSSSGSDKNSITDDKCEEPERDVLVGSQKQKRNSFVTVQSLQEVKGRLRRTSSPSDDVYKNIAQFKSDENIDDGIVTEENHIIDLKMPESNSPRQSRVRSYVYGMETMMNKKNVLGTGSLESRSSKQIGVGTTRSEDWHNRRKSYGFEQVHNQQEPISSITRAKTIIDSSTDSGICRSSEIVVVPITQKNLNYKTKTYKEKVSDYNSNYEKSSDSIPLSVGSVKRYTSIFENKNENGLPKQNFNDLNKSYDQSKKISKPLSNNDFGGTTITAPIILPNKNFNVFTPLHGDEAFSLKRHSIAVDESKYVKKVADTKYSRISLVPNDTYLPDDNDDESTNQNRKSKKVEFCKTEVHFAAESGRVNIVETDEKPPPTNNFRRRRRHSATIRLLDDASKIDLPLLHFGDSNYEKSQFVISDKENSMLLSIPQEINAPEKDTNINSTVTISTGGQNYYSDEVEDDQKDNLDNDTPRGILKNKPIKPKPYLLGDDNFFSSKNCDNEGGIWGVKLKSVLDKPDIPIWKSTVTLKNILYDKEQENKDKKSDDDVLQMELQKILQNLNQNNKQNVIDNYSMIPEKQNVIRINHLPVDLQQSAPLVSNVINQEDVQKLECRGYSTKVNIGHGEAIVVKDLDSKRTKNIWLKSDNLKDPPEALSDKNEIPVLNSLNVSNIMKQQKTPENRQQLRKPLPSHITHSPVNLRKNYEIRNPSAYSVEKLSSPSLVGQGQNVYSEHHNQLLKRNIPLTNSLHRKNNIGAKNFPEELSYSPGTYRRTRVVENNSPIANRKLSPSKLAENNLKEESYRKSPTVLRNPRKSEMTYFGITVSPSPKSGHKISQNEHLNNKPDLLQITPIKKGEFDASPIYENIPDIKVQKKFDSSILDELTKAADQILQAVNEYAEEANIKESMTKTRPNEKLDTISETKSLKHNSIKISSHVNSKSQHRAKRTSSTSSIDSITDHKRNLTVTDKKSTLDDDTRKKKNGSETSSSKAAVKARRLQRASSREALLQSHGSSSEDLLPISVPVRKPRLSKKVKSTNSTIMNETDTRKSIISDGNKFDAQNKPSERIPIGALPEIRHKTAISTIRSTAEKSAMRDRIQKSKQDETKKTYSRKDAIRCSSTTKTEKSRGVPNKESISHRISTASIKKCHKSEPSSRQ